jgi:hypothetical protein
MQDSAWYLNYQHRKGKLNTTIDGLNAQVEQRHTPSLLVANARTQPRTVLFSDFDSKALNISIRWY